LFSGKLLFLIKHQKEILSQYELIQLGKKNGSMTESSIGHLYVFSSLIGKSSESHCPRRGINARLPLARAFQGIKNLNLRIALWPKMQILID
jgi:hypothetical protein